MGPLVSVSLMDVAAMTAMVWIFPLCGAAAAFLTFKNKAVMARIAFIIALVVMIYRMFLLPEGPGMEIFDVAGIGFYLLMVTSIVGAIFSKE